MIHEMRTYDLKAVATREFEGRFAKALPHREKYSKLGAFWHTEIGPLDQVIHVWPYQDLDERERIRDEAEKDPNWPPPVEDLVLEAQSEILTPAPFMRPLGHQRLGNVYEMRIYTYPSDTIPEVVRLWSEAVPYREKYSPLAACWYGEMNGLTKWIHVWPYKDLAERERVRAEASKDPHWPAPTADFLVKMENKLLIPAAFSPMR